MGRYSLLDELGYRADALFHHMANEEENINNIVRVGTDLFVIPVVLSCVLVIFRQNLEYFFNGGLSG
jgi:hypothetical protein